MPVPPLSRRRFVTGSLGMLAAGSLPSDWLHAQPAATAVPELRGTDFRLTIGTTTVNYTGRKALATTINGTLPGPTLRWREGSHVSLLVHNGLREDTSLHWHGILLPANMDGVPGFSFHGIAPGESFRYHFAVKQAGTYWYHAHSSMQEATGVYGALIIDPADPRDDIAADADHVVLLSDWSDTHPYRILRKLKIQADYYNRHKRTVGDALRDVQQHGLAATLADRKAWGQMRMSPTDLADVSAPTYTFLANGQPPDGNWTALFAPGQRVRLRFINGSAMTFFDVRIPGLKMTVVAADGQRVHPVTVDEFRLAVAETLDVLVEPADQPYTVFAQAMDRSGYARATLAPRAGLSAPVPSLDVRPILTMSDMGHHGHGAHVGHDNTSGKGMEGSCGAAMMKGMEGGCGAAMGHGEAALSNPHASHGTASTDPHAAHGGSSDRRGMIAHPSSETGNPWVDMQTMTPSRAIDDPGIGLRGNGRRVLTLADLRSAFADPDGRDPARTIELHLTGNMERYVWGFDGIPFSKSEPIRLLHGERVRVVLVNDTMMEHPIHLHGLWSDVEDADGRFHVRRHTVAVPPGHVRSFRVTADALGRWAFHCHMLLHMELGMFREVRVEPAP